MMFDLNGRVALITGSSRGIGFALAEGLGKAGARLVINGRSEAAVHAACGRLVEAGLVATPSVFDVTDPQGVAEAVAGIEADVGPIDILINNAGIQHRAPLQDFPVEAFRNVLETNLFSAFYVGQAVARCMIPRRRGSIVNICSVQSELGRASIAPYTASKGGLKMLTKGMAVDWGPHGIRVNGLGPGYFKTELNDALVKNEEFTAWLTKRTPLGRWGNVDELIGAALFLASDASSFVTGHVLYVDGGITSSL
ncbi:SDR family oxidoreductase [Lichenihabitans sp. PAMC28606]|uniref:SDR family oxidoreductase n=1 Tax=Lichenihabitans sp. PAMC28606 TaxID=2880932 RepID=UPI001D0B78E4|nr:SDR family oxidoreductase [Lichenihabitans sp. PAMC28606]UDL94379.1 SDR family oxidoreductase [Lichenihabitans sp. PAMC28606]